MKNFAILFLIFIGFVKAQKIAYVDSEKILSKLPQYQESLKRLDNQIKVWQDEIAVLQRKLDSTKSRLQVEQIVLTDDQIKLKNQEIAEKEKEIKNLTEKRFGKNGDLVTLRVNIVKPIQDQIWNAVKIVAEKNRLNWVLDKGSELIFVYTDGMNDITQAVLAQLGIDEKKQSNQQQNKNQKK